MRHCGGVVCSVALTMCAVQPCFYFDGVACPAVCRGGLDGLLVDLLASLKACAGHLGFHAAHHFKASDNPKNPKADIEEFFKTLPNNYMHFFLVRAGGRQWQIDVMLANSKHDWSLSPARSLHGHCVGSC